MSTSPTLVRSLVPPALLALVLGALLLLPRAAPAARARPLLVAPVVLDALVLVTASTPPRPSAPAQASQTTPEGLRRLRAH